MQKSSLRSIPCKRYYSSSFCCVFKIKPTFLPCFAVLTGNDFVRNDYMTYKAQYGCPELEGLLEWMR